MKIGLLWHSFTSDNLGVGALSLANFEMIDKCARSHGLTPEYMVIGTKGQSNYLPFDPKTRHSFLPFNGSELKSKLFFSMRQIASCDVIFDIGEGDSFTDIYGLKRFVLLVMSKIVPLLNHKPILMSPQTIGPFTSTITSMLAQGVMRHCSAVVARDHLSFEVLTKMKVPRPLEAIDVAFRLPFFSTKTKQSTEKISVGLNVSALLHYGGYNGDNQFELSIDYRKLTIDFIETVLGSGRYELHLVPHVISENLVIEDDFAIAKWYQEQYPEIIVPSRFSGPVDAKSYISGLDFFTGARMHATIAAFSTGVPVVPLAYSRKFNGLYESLSYQHYVDMRSMSTASALAKMLDCLENREALKIDLLKARKEVECRLCQYEIAINEIFGVMR